jgi:hypothetical protein
MIVINSGVGDDDDAVITNNNNNNNNNSDYDGNNVNNAYTDFVSNPTFTACISPKLQTVLLSIVYPVTNSVARFPTSA